MVIGKPLFTPEQIQERVKALAEDITRDYAGKEILAVGILKGAFIFFSDLVRQIKVPITVDFIIASSYVKTQTTGEVKIYYDVREPLEGKHVLLIEDIVDTGITLNFIRERILQRSPESLKICAFLDKKERRIVDVPIDYRGFVIPNEYVVGYGLDYDNKFRNLPYISIFKKKCVNHGGLMYELMIEDNFSAAHQLRGYKGECEKLHGHNWRVQVFVIAERLNEIDIAIDFHELKSYLKDILSLLDHKFLNEVFPFTEKNPSSENIAKWIFDSMKKKVNREDVRVVAVTVWESDRASATYYED